MGVEGRAAKLGQSYGMFLQEKWTVGVRSWVGVTGV